MLVLNLVVGRIADRADDWRQVIVIGAALAGIIPIGLFFVHGFVGILLVWTLAAIPFSAVGPVADAAAMRMTKRNGTDFGFIRAWGTVGYMAVIVITGQIVTWFGGGTYLPFFVGVAILRGLAAFQLPNFRAPKEERTLAQKFGASRMREVMKPWFLLPLVGWSMVFATHLILNSFQALLWKQQGISDLTIAVLPAQQTADGSAAGGFGLVMTTASRGIAELTGWTPRAPLSGQRCLTRRVFELASPLAAGWGMEVGMTVDVLRAGLRIEEIEIDLRHRATGTDLSSQLHRAKQLRDVSRALAARGAVSGLVKRIRPGR